METKRLAGIDLVKAAAIFCVLVIHSCIPGYSRPLGGFDWYSSVFWGSVTRMAVPLFLMCTGALLLDPAKSFSAPRFFRKNFLRLFIALFFWAAVYKLYRLVFGGGLTGAGVVQALKELVLFRHEDHLYYLHIALLVYAFVPVLRVLAEHAGKKCLIWLLALWAALGILYPTVRGFWPFTLLGGVPAQWMLNMTWASLGYVLLGFFMRTYPPKRGAAALIFAAGFAVTFGGTVLMSLRAGTLDTTFLEGMTVGVALEAAGAFGLLSSAKPRGTAAKVTGYISRASFCVYLVHLLVMYALGSLGVNALLLPCIISIPLMALVLLAVSCAVYFVLSKIPLVNRYLI